MRRLNDPSGSPVAENLKLCSSGWPRQSLRHPPLLRIPPPLKTIGSGRGGWGLLVGKGARVRSAYPYRACPVVVLMTTRPSKLASNCPALRAKVLSVSALSTGKDITNSNATARLIRFMYPLELSDDVPRAEY